MTRIVIGSDLASVSSFQKCVQLRCVECLQDLACLTAIPYLFDDLGISIVRGSCHSVRGTLCVPSWRCMISSCDLVVEFASAARTARSGEFHSFRRDRCMSCHYTADNLRGSSVHYSRLARALGESLMCFAPRVCVVDTRRTIRVTTAETCHPLSCSSLIAKYCVPNCTLIETYPAEGAPWLSLPLMGLLCCHS